MSRPIEADGSQAIAGSETRRERPGPTAAPTERRRSRGRRVVFRIVQIVVGLIAAYYVISVLLLVLYRFVAPPITGVQLERRVGALIAGRQYEQKKRFIPYSRIPPHVARAVVAAEDGRFWTHSGFDVKEMAAASTEIFDGEMPRGASTITQQLVKNLFGCTCRNPVRKFFDYALTIPAEVILGKERILELYLNNVEWGPGVFGVDAGARHHYGVGARSLSRTQAAGLAALLPNPLRRTPRNTPQYRSEILRRMGVRGW
jgi:monofunctional biosynthetic peptidoglycan transglycosylase